FEKIPLLVMAAAASWMTIAVHREAVDSLEELSAGARTANAALSYVAYIRDMVWPVRLAAFYPIHIPAVWPVVGAVLLFAAISVAVVWKARRMPYLVIGWLWYLLVAFPVIGIIQVGSQARADRYTYLPLIGIFIMVAWGVPQMLASVPWRRTAMLIAF